MKTLEKCLLTVFVLWLTVCFVSSFASMLLGIVGFAPPKWLPLPWSDFTDFVETPNGHVFVDIGFHYCVLCYDREGNFVGTYRYPGGNHRVTELAVDDENHIYFRARSVVYTMTETWQQLGVVSEDYDPELRWRLGDDRVPVPAPDAKDGAPSRPVRRGELLFPHSLLGELELPQYRRFFWCADGSLLRRVGNRFHSHLERVSAKGEVVATYSSAWIYKPFVFPFPGGLAWPAVLALAVYLAWRESRRHRKGARLEASSAPAGSDASGGRP